MSFAPCLGVCSHRKSLSVELPHLTCFKRLLAQFSFSARRNLRFAPPSAFKARFATGSYARHAQLSCNPAAHSGRVLWQRRELRTHSCGHCVVQCSSGQLCLLLLTFTLCWVRGGGLVLAQLTYLQVLATSHVARSDYSYSLHVARVNYICCAIATACTSTSLHMYLATRYLLLK